MIGATVSHYRILAHLGGGGMGVVYRALDTRLGRPVALKFLPDSITREDTDALERFQREAYAASALNHPNICVIHAFDEHDGRPFIVMELLDGCGLDQLIRDRRISTDRVLEVGIQVCRGLEAAHALGIVHRDVKPSNIVVTGQGISKLLDFGLAKLTEIPVLDTSGSSMPTPGADPSRLTRPGALTGTVGYMSPEQAMGEPVDARTDLFSLGVTLYEATTGRLPFQGKTLAGRLDELLHQEPPAPSSLNPELAPGLDTVLLKCLRKRPHERYQSASELREELSKVQSGGLPKIPPPPQAAFRLSRIPLPLRWILLVFLGLTVLLGVATVRDWRWWPFLEPAPQDLAVLPFVNVGDSNERVAEALGLTYDVTSALTRVQRFRERFNVVPASEVLSMDCRSPGQARNYFRVDLVITGTLEWTDTSLRLTLNLVDAAALRQLDSEVIVEPLSTVHRLWESVIRELDRMLDLSLEPGALSVLAAGGTQAAAAFEHYQRGLGYLERYFEPGNPERAIHAFRRALEEDPAFAVAHAGLARALYRQFELDNRPETLDLAGQECREAQQLDSQLAQAFIVCGLVEAARGRRQEAVREFRTALQLEPRDIDALTGLATHLEPGSPEAIEVRTQLEQSVQPGAWYGLYQLGIFHFRQGDYAAALEAFRRTQALVPENYKVHNNLGGANANLGQLDRATENFLTSAQITPNYAAFSNLGTIYSWRKDFPAAVEMYRRAVELNGTDHVVWGHLASACRRVPDCEPEYLGYYRRAEELVARRIDINPGDPWLKADRADYLAELGARDESAAMLEEVLRSLDTAPQPAELAFLATQVFVVLDRPDSAFRWLEEALQRGLIWSRVDGSESLGKLRTDPRFEQLAVQYGTAAP